MVVVLQRKSFYGLVTLSKGILHFYIVSFVSNKEIKLQTFSWNNYLTFSYLCVFS